MAHSADWLYNSRTRVCVSVYLCVRHFINKSSQVTAADARGRACARDNPGEPAPVRLHMRCATNVCVLLLLQCACVCVCVKDFYNSNKLPVTC